MELLYHQILWHFHQNCKFEFCLRNSLLNVSNWSWLTSYLQRRKKKKTFGSHSPENVNLWPLTWKMTLNNVASQTDQMCSAHDSFFWIFRDLCKAHEPSRYLVISNTDHNHRTAILSSAPCHVSVLSALTVSSSPCHPPDCDSSSRGKLCYSLCA